MDYMIAYSCLLIFARPIVGATEIHKGNELWMFHLDNDAMVSEKSTQLVRFTLSIMMNLNVSFLPISRNFQENLEAFCDIFKKVKVLALLFPPDLENRTELTLAAKHLATPVLHLPKSSKDIHVSSRSACSSICRAERLQYNR